MEGNETEKGDTIKLMGNQVSYDKKDSILVGPWGGTGGLEWNYKLKSPIKEIIIAHEKVIDSIIFRSVSEQGTIDSKKFGGNGGGRRDKVVMEATPLEYLIGIKGKIGHYYGNLVIKSLNFITNAKSYGPFGSESSSGTPFSFVMKEGGAIVGFYGRAGLYLDSIGVYLQKLTLPNSTKEVEDTKIDEPHEFIAEEIQIHDGNQVSYDQEDSILVEPWGGTGGSEWNYKLKCPIREILIAHGDVIDSIILTSEQGNIESPKFGGNGGRRDMVVLEATPLEYLIGINGKTGHYYGNLVVKSLSFITNAKTYGPFGSEAGTGTSFSFVMKEGGVIVGFHGRAGSFLDSIGVYLQKLTPPNSTKEVEDTEIDEPHESIVEEIQIHEVEALLSIEGGGKGWNYPQLLLENIKSFINMHRHSKSTRTLTVEQLVDLLDALIVNLADLPKFCVQLRHPSMTRYDILLNVCGNIRDFLLLKVNGYVEHEIIEYALPQFQILVERLGHFWIVLSARLDFDYDETDHSDSDHDETDHSDFNVELAHLVVKIIPVVLEVMHICSKNLKASKSSEVGDFIKRLLEASPFILREYLIHLQEYMVTIINATTSTRDIHVMIEFLLIILTDDVSKDFIHHDKFFDILTRVGELSRVVSVLAQDLEEKSQNEESTSEMSYVTLDLLENIKLFKRDLKHVYLKAPNPMHLYFPMSDGPLFMNLLLKHLNDLLSSNAYSVALIHEEIRLAKKDLEFLRSFFRNVEQDLWIHVLDVAYEAECAINSILVRDHGLLQFIFFLPDTIEKIKHIKEELPVKIPKIEMLTLENSTKKSVERKSSTTGKIIVGFKEEADWIIRKLTSGPAEIDVISIVGMPGIGKSTLSYSVYNDKCVVRHFDVLAWCTVDQEHNVNKLLQSIFNQVISLKGTSREGVIDDDIPDKLRKELYGKRFFIVLDDLWDTDTLDELIRPFPEVGNRSRIIITSRKLEVALHRKRHSDPLKLRLFRPEESWELLERRVFGEESCPDELLDVGKEIAQNCQGLPLVVDLIAGVIAKRENKRTSWLEVRNKFKDFIFNNEVDVMKVIQLSYDHLPDHLKPCLLYLGCYQKDERIVVSELKKLWSGEGFVAQTDMKNFEEVVDDYMHNLVSSNMVTVFNQRGEKTICQIHDLIHDFCVMKATKEMRFHSIGSDAPSSLSSSSSSSDLMSPRVTIHYGSKKKIHFGKHLLSLNIFTRGVDNHSSSDLMSHRMTIHYGSKKKIHVGKHLLSLNIFTRVVDNHYLRHMRLLRVLSLYSSFSPVTYSLLTEICTLTHLRYLKITSKVKALPSSFSNLWNLETLWMENVGDPVVLIPQIWNLVKLRHVRVRFCTFFDLDKEEPLLLAEDSKLEALRSLTRLLLSYSKDTEDILERFPNLQVLKCRMRRSWDCNWCPNFDVLNELEHLQVSFVSDKESDEESSNSKESRVSSVVKYQWDFHFPLSLKKLDLADFALSSKSLSTIARLPNLEELRLVRTSFQGDEWIIDEDSFVNLKHLELWNGSLAKWEVGEESFPVLEHLNLTSCARLEDIPSTFRDILTLKRINLVDCKHLKDSALEIKEYVEEMMGEDKLDLEVVEICTIC